MKPCCPRRRPLRTLATCALLIAALGACTLVHVEGDHNSVRDTGGHGDIIVKKQQPVISACNSAWQPPCSSASEEIQP